MVGQSPWQQQITHCWTYKSVRSTLMGLIMQLKMISEKIISIFYCSYLILIFPDSYLKIDLRFIHLNPIKQKP